MSKVKKTADYKIEKKRSGRFAVVGKNGKYINGEAKRDILVQEKLIKLTAPTKKKEAEAAPAAEA